MVEAHIDDLAVVGEGENTAFLVLLKTKDDEVITIVVGYAEFMSIHLGRTKELSRPMTHDLMLSSFEMLNANIKRIEISDLQDGTYYGQLILEQRGMEYDIDARPSDCMALAVRVDAPIFIAEEVVEKAATSDDFTSGDRLEA